PSRVLMTDSNGIPALLDLVSLRDAVADEGGDVASVDLHVDADLVVDHSVISDQHGAPDSERSNRAAELGRNRERFEFLRWAAEAFRQLRVVPPGKGICHQINLERLASVAREVEGTIRPDTVVGSDSHTTMINALGVLGWGAGGIEVVNVLLGKPLT